MTGALTADSLFVVAGRVVSFCAAVVLLAVARNFALADRGATVTRERRSVVATGTMLAFFVAVYLIIHYRLGVVRLPDGLPAAATTLVGLLLVVAGCVVNLLGRFSLAGNWANQAVVYQQHALVTSGVYGWLRHPLYASLIWMFGGAALAFHNLAAMLATLVVYVPAMHYRAALEEALLAERFADYADYRARTGRFVPWRRSAP